MKNKTTDILLAKANSPMEKAARLVELEATYRQIKERIIEYKEDLLKTTQEMDVLSLKTGKYTITRVKKVTPRVVDFTALKAALKKAKIPFGTKEVFDDYMSVVFKRAIEEKRELDGLEVLETEYIMVRIADKKHDS